METIDLIIPCYNESASLPLLYTELCKITESLSNYTFRMLFVDDGSRDNTLQIIRELAGKDQRVRFVSFSRNFGKEAAMYAGLSHADADYTAILDADMQDPPALLPDMLKILQEGYDCCATRRVDRKGEPKIRSFFARKFYHLINKMIDFEIVDGARDFRLMTRQMTQAILRLTEVERFSKGIFAWVGFSTKWLEYQNVERVAGETKWSFWKLLKYAFSGIIAFTTVPLRFASITGALTSFVSFLYFIYIILRTAIKGVDLPGYASTIAILLIMGGLILLSCGILGEYLARMYMEVKRRPIYIEKLTNFQQASSSEHNRPE